jgi:hypothetical protein
MVANKVQRQRQQNRYKISTTDQLPQSKSLPSIQKKKAQDI